MLPDKNLKCHHTGFTRTCLSIVSEGGCAKFIHIVGSDPNTGQPVNKAGCADGFMHMLLIENAKETRQAAAAIESFRNEMVRGNENALRLQSEAVARLTSEPSDPRLVAKREPT